MQSVQALYAWYRIPNTNLATLSVPNWPDADAIKYNANAPKYNAAAIRSYSGCATNKNGSKVFAHGGGHASTFSNHIAMIDLTVDAPAWGVWASATPWTSINFATDSTNWLYQTTANEFIRNSIPSISGFWPVTLWGTGAYVDGRPVSGHLGYRNHYVESENRFYRFGGGPDPTGGVGTVINPPSFYATKSVGVWVYDKATDSWLDPGLIPNSPPAYYLEASAHDPRNDDYYHKKHANGQLWRWSASTKTWTNLGGNYPSESERGDSVMCVDTQRGWVVCLGPTSFVYDINAKTFFTPNFSSTIVPSKSGMVYDSLNDEYLVMQLDASIYRIKPAAATSVWQVSQVSLGTINASPVAAESGIFNGFGFSPTLGIVWYAADRYIPASGTVDCSIYVFRVR